MVQPNSGAPPTEATPASQWRGARFSGHLITLPSGNNAYVKRTLSLVNAIRHGTLPNALAPHVNRMLQVGPNNPASAIEQGQLLAKDLPPESWATLLEMIEEEIYEIFLDPKVYRVPEGEDPLIWRPSDERGLTIDDLSWEDRMFAFNFAQGASADLKLFRDTKAALASVANVSGVFLPPEPPSAYGGPVPGVES